MTALKSWMQASDACSESLEWVGSRTAAKAWKECQRGDWMMWALGKTKIDRRELVRVCCDIALSVLPLNDDPRVAAAIDAAEGWCAGVVSLEEVRSAAYASAAAASYAAAVFSAAAFAADAAADAAFAASYAAAVFSASSSSSSAVFSASSSSSAAYAADAADAATRSEYLSEIADLIRSRVSPAEFAKLIREAA